MIQRLRLLEGMIDYAGLFPPASLSLTEAMGRYETYRTGEDAWALGGFVLPAGRLEEFQRSANRAPPKGRPWPLSITVPVDHGEGLAQVHAFRAADTSQSGIISLIEAKVRTPEMAQTLVDATPAGVDLFLEVDLTDLTESLVQGVAGAGGFVKFRTGGVTPDAIPKPEHLLRGLEAVVAAGVPFKCTAGLHHPVRGSYPLTYEEGSTVAVMHGYLNVLLAAGFLMEGWRPERALAVLLDSAAESFEMSADRVAWRGESLAEGAIEHLRRGGLRSFGSCSFREPIDELALLPVS